MKIQLTTLTVHFPIFLVFTGGLMAIRKLFAMATTNVVSGLVGKRLHVNNKKSLTKDSTADEKLAKSETAHAVENLWFCLYYPFITLWGLKILSQVDWWKNFDSLFKDIPHTDLDTNFELNCFYLFQYAFYVQALFCLIFVDQRMKDFNQFLIHHICTILAITISYFAGVHRAGMLTMSLHDITDVFLYLSKFIIEVGYKPIATVAFLMFLFCYTFLRLGYFPYLVWSMQMNEYAKLIPSHGWFFAHVDNVDPIFEFSLKGICINKYCISTWKISILSMAVLICVHLFWYYLAWRVALRGLRDVKIYDIRKAECVDEEKAKEKVH